MTAVIKVKDVVLVTKIKAGNNATLEKPIQLLYPSGLNSDQKMWNQMVRMHNPNQWTISISDKWEEIREKKKEVNH